MSNLSKKRGRPKITEPLYQFYSFPQKYNGSHYILNKERGISLYTIIQAQTLSDAVKKAMHIGIVIEDEYGSNWNGCEFGCPSCQPRWRLADIRESSTPRLGSNYLTHCYHQLKDAVCIHLVDGTFGFLGENIRETPYELAKLFYRLHGKYKHLDYLDYAELARTFTNKTSTKEAKQAMFNGVMFKMPEKEATIKVLCNRKKEVEQTVETPLEVEDPIAVYPDTPLDEREPFIPPEFPEEVLDAIEAASGRGSPFDSLMNVISPSARAQRIRIEMQGRGFTVPEREEGESNAHYAARLAARNSELIQENRERQRPRPTENVPSTFQWNTFSTLSQNNETTTTPQTTTEALDFREISDLARELEELNEGEETSEDDAQNI